MVSATHRSSGTPVERCALYDYVSSGDDVDLLWLEGELEKAYEIKTQRLGIGDG